VLYNPDFMREVRSAKTNQGK